MAKTWYPVIDYLTCLECGTCVSFCPHGVYDTEKAPSPVVVNTANCIDHCHGCGNKCLVGAIAYVGDNTGWMPPSAKTHEISETCCCGGDSEKETVSCSCDCEQEPAKRVLIEYLYLDLNTCDRCIGTDAVLDETVAAITPALKLAGFAVDYEKHEIATPELATQHRFLSSPTIRVNGQDICECVAETNCGCCGEISSTDVDCRVFEYEGKPYEVPPKAMLAEAIFKAVFSANIGCSCRSYTLPENLKRFYDGKITNTPKCSCGGKC